MEDKLNKLGTRYGFNDNDETKTSGPNPVENMLAISAWHSALSRMIAYAWKNWENEKELEYIVKFPEYYLAKFGFFPQIPAYQTKVRFVIKKGDSVTFTYGSQTEGGTIKAKVESVDETKEIVEQLSPSPKYIVENDSLPTSSDILSVASLVDAPDGSPTDEQIRDKLRAELGLDYTDGKFDDSKLALYNGWHFENMSELTGCFIVTIPPKPELSNLQDESKRAMIETQAINDFMDICRSHPFTSC
ncbi:MULTISPECIES: hypothetical protein [Pseudoalteromonas]|uniref:Uncharacterized protein n=1 Tax=Pseudoalteromonas amylolytica TaxID=1859457 RepID=A0A1S1MQA4_9GAMM|nr:MULTISPECIES: hypothetical protein [Pseudoalteromonas]OHU84322.1 hypothetical protein BFC16_01400 [Pseudoalteromonas sp. JW3]OHU87139.1 hypothetical protein BET10_00540 [Pseudoalteromonas amylolytica]